MVLYHSFVYPYLTYGLEIWGNTFDKYIKLLHLLQKKVVHIIKGIGPRDSTKHLFKELKILCIYKLYKFSVVVFMFRFIKGELPDIFTNMYIFNSDVHNYVTRNVNELKLPLCKLEICQRHIRYTGVKIWNLVSSSIIHNCSLYTFKKQLYTY